MRKNRTKLFVANATASAFQQIAIFISGLIVPNVMLRYYGSEINGLVSSVTQLVSYITLIEAGMSGSIVYFLYKPLAENNKQGINRIVSAAKVSYNRLGSIFLVLSLIAALVYSFFMQVNGLAHFDVFALTFFIGLSGALEYFTMSKYRVLFTADQRNYVLSVATIASTFVHILVVVFCAMLGCSVVVLKAVSILTVFTRSIILYFYLKVKYKWVSYKEEPDFSALGKRWDAFYMQVLWSLQSGAPIMIATVFTDLVSVSIYSIYSLIITGINNMVSIFMTGLQAAFGEILVQNDQEKLTSVYRQFCFIFYCLLGIIFSIAMVMIMPFINVYVSGVEDAAQYYDITLGMMFILNGILFSMKTPQGMMIIAAGHYKETRVQTTVQALILVVLGVLFAGTFHWGLRGILLAAILSNGYRVIDLLIYVNKHVVKHSLSYTFENLISAVIHVLLVFVLFCMIPIHVTGYMSWLLYAILIGVVSVVVLFVKCLLLNRNDLKALVPRIKALFVRKGN